MTYPTSASGSAWVSEAEFPYKLLQFLVEEPKREVQKVVDSFKSSRSDKKTQGHQR